MESSPSLSLCLLLLLFAYSFTTISRAQPRFEHCQSKCGNYRIDYPFGIADMSQCYLQGFQIRCINGTVPVLAAANFIIDKFMMDQGKVALRSNTSLMAFECEKQTAAEANQRVCLSLPLPFTISARSNRFMALGCDTLATVTDDRSFNSSCRTHWTTGGLGHCQSALPEASASFCYDVSTVNGYQGCASSATRCSFATLVAVPLPAELRSEASLVELTRPEKKGTASYAFVADWEVESAGGNPCGPNTRCNVSVRGSGYLCQCLEGFSGNPYLNDTGGCRSHNNNFPSAPVAIAAGFALVATFAAGSYVYNIYYPAPEGTIPTPSSGPTLEHVAKIVKIWNMSNKLYEMMGRMRGKGPLVEYKPLKVDDTSQIEPFTKQFNAFRRWVRHPNAVRPYKCDLDAEALNDATLVYYKFYQHNLHDYLHNGGGDGGSAKEEKGEDAATTVVVVAENANYILSWKDRIKIAAGTARALACAHSQGFMHMDVRSSNILLDDKLNAKMIQFGVAMLLTPTTYMEGSKGYLDPEFVETSKCSFKSDVYGFGVLLVELLTSKDPSLDLGGEKGDKGLVKRFLLSTDEEIDEYVKRVSCEEQLIKVVRLAEECLREKGEMRPTLCEVVEVLSSVLEVECPDMDLNENIYEDLKKDAVETSMDLAAETEKTVEGSGGKTLYELLTGT